MLLLPQEFPLLPCSNSVWIQMTLNEIFQLVVFPRSFELANLFAVPVEEEGWKAINILIEAQKREVLLLAFTVNSPDVNSCVVSVFLCETVDDWNCFHALTAPWHEEAEKSR